jgi:hypothetical protein
MAACRHEGDKNVVHDDCQGTGGRTHALVIGVGNYSQPRPRRGKQSKGFDNLPGAARAAYRFARYLIKEFHEPEERSLATLRVMLSPLDRESRDVEPLKGGDATRREVGNALQDWADDCNTCDQNLAILYVAGHGVALDKSVSTVFLADSLEEGNRYLGAINLSLVQDYMGGCAAKDNIFVYDCCALRPEDVPAVTGAGGVFIERFPPRDKARENWVTINAARVGTETFALDEKGTLLSWGLLGAYTDHMGEDALLRTAGDLFDDARFGITASRLKADINSRLQGLLSSIRHPDDKYEASVGLGGHDHIAIPEPTPQFEVVLRNVLTGRTPPVRVRFERVGGEAGEVDPPPVDIDFDGQSVQLPAGLYIPHVEGAEGSPKPKSFRLVKRQEVEMPP